MNRARHQYWRWLLVIVWIGFIWFMSAHSSPPGDPIGRLANLVEGTPLEPPTLAGKSVHFSIGKLGHLWEYCVLGGLLAWALLEHQMHRLLPASTGVFVAAVDETIQRVTPGREGCLRDVIIDTTGLLVGLVLFYFGLRLLGIYQRRHRRQT